MKHNNFIQGYAILNKVEITDEYMEMLNQLKNQYLVEFDLIKDISGRELYYIVIRDEKYIEDQQTEEGNTIPGLLTVMSERNPEILGCWKYDGTPLGQTKNVTSAEYNEEGELISEEIITYSGTETYPFKKSIYLNYMNDIVTYDEEGNEVSRVKPTTPKPIRLFAGFKEPIMEGY